MNGICIYYQLIFEWFILNPLKPKYILRSIHMINPFWFIQRIIKFIFGLKRWKRTSDKVVEEDHTHTMFIFGIMFQNVIPLMSFEKQHSGGPLLTPKMKYLVELMILFSTRQMGYFDMLQNAKSFRPRAYRLRHTTISTKDKEK